MAFPKHIFKKYDIRGLVDVEITDELAEQIGLAFAVFRARELPQPSFVCAVGRDMRKSSVHLQEALMRGLVEQGVHVLDVGLVSTPAFYFSVGHLKADAGIMVSASHNPAAYNGFKLTREMAVPVSGDTGILEIGEMVEKGQKGQKGQKGEIKKIDGIPQAAAQAEFVYAGKHPIKRLKIVADAANGMGAQYLDELFKMIDADVTRMFWEFDGSFPNHEADPFKEENTTALQAKVRELGADLGIATDGDGDRIFFVDDTGARVEPSVVRGLLAQIVLRTHPGATICYDVRPGKITPDMIVEAGGTPSVTRVGHSLIKEQMRRVGAPFGGESSGHFFYAFPTGVYEGPVTVAAQILQEMTRRGQTLSQIVGPLCARYAHSGELNFEVQDKEAVLARLKERYADGDLNELDGISITYPHFWFNVRGSNTEPKLRLNLEAIDKKTMEEKRDEIKKIIL
ncbi:phosphomannomutase/phosphoglucomutase [Candidatus Uhrbacteria bacterium]|nr:phosphomannomutase/phosphoglucomutase [Candidatus Uhrbacteria bacterium]